MTRLLTDAQFIAAWQSSQDTKEMVRRTGFTYTSAVTRAWRLRRAGHDLKRFTRTTKSGEAVGGGIMTWLKANYPEVYGEWKAREGNETHSKLD